MASTAAWPLAMLALFVSNVAVEITSNVEADTMATKAPSTLDGNVKV
jgi:hypothetical protein